MCPYIYVGSGFRTLDIPSEALLAFIQKYDGEAFYEYLETNKLDVADMNTTDLEDFICENHMDVADYIVSIINAEEPHVELIAYEDEFVLYDCIDFAKGNEARMKRVPSLDALNELINQFLPGVKCEPVFAGNGLETHLVLDSEM